MFVPAHFNWHDLLRYEKEDGGGGTPPPATDPPAATPPAVPPTSGDPKDGKGEGDGDLLKFTSVQLKERLDRAKESELSSILKTLGVSSVEDAKKLLKDGQDALRARMSEQEKLQADLAAAQQATQEAADRATKAETAATQARLEASALSLMAGKFANPKAALKLLELTSVDLADPKFPGLPEAVEKLAKDEPWTLLTNHKTGKPLVPNLGPTNPETTGKPAITDAERHQRYFGGGVKNSSFFQGGGVKVSGGSQKIGGA